MRKAQLLNGQALRLHVVSARHPLRATEGDAGFSPDEQLFSESRHLPSPERLPSSESVLGHSFNLAHPLKLADAVRESWEKMEVDDHETLPGVLNPILQDTAAGSLDRRQ
jgi:hypothetical protein